jgi:hypothetical protein
MRASLLAIAVLSLCACQPATQTAQKPAEPAAPAAPKEPLDPFIVMVDAERWNVLLDKAIEGVREAPEKSVGIAENDQARADRAVKDGAARLLTLRNAICGKRILMGDDCVIKDWPAWASEGPAPETSLEVTEQRSGWLSGAMEKFTDLGCEAGRAAFKDEMYCSVE